MSIDVLRAKEARMQLIVGGVRQEGSFFKIRNFSINPRSEFVHTDYTGDKRQGNNLLVHGYEFSMQFEEVNADWFDVWRAFEDWEARRATFPIVTAVITKRYPAPNQRWTATLFDQLILKWDGNSLSGNEQVPVDISGVCKQMNVV